MEASFANGIWFPTIFKAFDKTWLILVTLALISIVGSTKNLERELNRLFWNLYHIVREFN